MSGNKEKVSAIRCFSYEKSELLDRVREAVKLAGGFPEKVKKSSKVLLKPNMLTARAPEYAVTTHPEFIRAVILLLKEIGAEITVGDSPAGGHQWEKVWTDTGIKKVCEEENVTLMPFENVKIIKLKKGQNIPVLKELDDFDALISLPKLKTHTLTKITGAIKNSYGLVIGHAKSHFHSIYPSPRKMSEFIGELYGYIKPDFVIMDAIVCMEGDGPNTGHPFNAGMIFTGRDGVAVDSCAVRVFEYDCKDILHINVAAEKGYGILNSNNIDKLGNGFEELGKIRGRRSKADFLFKIPEKLFFVITMVTRSRPSIDDEKCVKCGICMKACSQKAIFKQNERYKVKASKCVLCMCCIEACSYQAISFRSSKIWETLLRGVKLLYKLNKIHLS